jgi:hypothetical protein
MYGGSEYNLPATHKAGLVVPRGGAMCKNCKFLGEDHKTCKNNDWITWNSKDNNLPVEDERYCCDWWTSRGLQRKEK